MILGLLYLTLHVLLWHEPAHADIRRWLSASCPFF